MEEDVNNIKKDIEEYNKSINDNNDKIKKLTDEIEKESTTSVQTNKQPTPKKTYIQTASEYVTAPVAAVGNTVYNTGKSVYDLLGYYAFGN